MSLSKRVRFQVLVRDNYTCKYCGAHPPDTVLEIDHIIPRCKGGSDAMENLATACWNCNRGKAGMPLLREWTFFESHFDGPGPFHGEKRMRLERFPAYWVYNSDDVFQLYEDEIDADLYFAEWEERLKWGPPGACYCGPNQESIRDRWNNSYPSRFPKVERRLVGLYLPLEMDACKGALLGWFPGATAIDHWLTIHTTRPDDGEPIA